MKNSIFLWISGKFRVKNAFCADFVGKFRGIDCLADEFETKNGR